jgi:hypothetical protein
MSITNKMLDKAISLKQPLRVTSPSFPADGVFDVLPISRDKFTFSTADGGRFDRRDLMLADSESMSK